MGVIGGLVHRSVWKSFGREWLTFSKFLENGWPFPNFFGMMWVMALKWSSSRMCDLDIVNLKKLFWNYKELVRIRSLLLWRFCISLMWHSTGMISSLAQCKIWSWNHWPCLWTWYIPCQCGVLVLIKYVGSLLSVEVLRFEDIITFYPLIMSCHLVSLEIVVAIKGSS